MRKYKRISTIISGRWLSFFAVTVLALAMIIPTAAKSASAVDLGAPVVAETTVVKINVAQPLEEYVWVKYIVQPGDYIKKIAVKEYGVTAMWRQIWYWNIEVIGDDPNRLTPFVELLLKKEAADVTGKTVDKPEVKPIKKDASVVIAITVDKPEVKPIKKDTADVTEKAIEEPEVKPIKEDMKPYSWKFKLYGSYGMVEPLGVVGTSQLGWNGNLIGGGAPVLFDNMYTWEVGFMLHPYGWTGNEAQRPNSIGVSFDYASFDYVGTVDPTIPNFNANDTTATRYSIGLVFQQNLIGQNNSFSKLTIYFEESLRIGVHSFGFINGDLSWNNHISGGIGLAQGINFFVFDLKLYETLSYSPEIARITGFPILQSLVYEVGLRLGIALKF